MVQVNRRRFVGATAAAATVLGGQQAAVASEVPPPPQVPLGQTGITMSRVGQGTGVHGGKRQSDQTRMGFEKLVNLFHHAYDRGITFFDLADLYGSHVYFREALRTLPREKVTILSKMWWRYDGPESGTRLPHRKQDVRTTLERFRHELNTDYVDILLLHCMKKGTWDEELELYMEELAAAKQKGQVRAVGVSCHDYGALKTAAKCPWVDVVLARINPKGVKMDPPKGMAMDAAPEAVTAVLEEMKANGKAVIGMKIFGEGQLSGEKENCIKFAQELGVLDAMTIGFNEPEQIDDVLRMIQKFPAKPV
jgi:aryl-alcohol dehydrogenase-like predicted oxidoreductase